MDGREKKSKKTSFINSSLLHYYVTINASLFQAFYYIESLNRLLVEVYRVFA